MVVGLFFGNAGWEKLPMGRRIVRSWKDLGCRGLEAWWGERLRWDGMREACFGI